LVVEHDRRLRERLGALLENAGWNVVLATSSLDALPHTASNPPDVILVDLALVDSDAVDVIRILSAGEIATPIIGIAESITASRLLAAFRNGASGCLTVADLPSRLLPALEEALDGGAPVSSHVGKILIDEVCLRTSRGSGPRPAVQALTSRERAVLEQLARGLSYEDVASVLGVSVNTVRTYVRTIYDKLAVRSRTEAVLVGLRLGIVNRTPFPKTGSRPPG
jgi:DNA-binding NarL/FixJ family response regulator